MATELIGWVSSVVLLLTIGRQVLTQWRTKSSAGLSRWLFLGQLSASTGFTICSVLLANWVFVVTNVALLVTAIFGQVIYVRNRKRPGSVAEPAAHP